MKTPNSNRIRPPRSNRAGRPTNQELEENPPQRVEAHLVDQPPLVGLRNPPCCGTAMIPRDLRQIGQLRYRGQCSHCGKRLVIQYDDKGMPILARVQG